MLGEHLRVVRALMDTVRYHNKFGVRKRTVAEHSWFVCKISHALAMWERDKFKQYAVDMEKVLFIAINHDIVEAYTGDIISTTKNLSELFRSELAKEEERIFREEIAGTIPKSWGPKYIDLHIEMSELETIESRIVKAADVIDRLYECLEEIDQGNTKPYTEILVSDMRRLLEMDLMSVNYFMKYSIKDIGGYDYIPEELQTMLEKMDFSEYF